MTRYLLDLLDRYEQDGQPRVYITVAGRSNALSGVVDANSRHPVIACPPYGERFGGMDLLSSVRMPGGVAPMLVLEPEGAALAAAKILAMGDPALAQRIAAWQVELREQAMADDREAAWRVTGVRRNGSMIEACRACDYACRPCRKRRERSSHAARRCLINRYSGRS